MAYQFLAALPIAAVPGLGGKVAQVCEEKGFTRIGQLSELPLEALTHLFGEVTARMYVP